MLSVIVMVYSAWIQSLLSSQLCGEMDTKALEGLQKQANEIDALAVWDLDELEQQNRKMFEIIKGLLKAKKPPVQQRSLRIYSTGD